MGQLELINYIAYEFWDKLTNGTGKEIQNYWRSNNKHLWDK